MLYTDGKSACVQFQRSVYGGVSLNKMYPKMDKKARVSPPAASELCIMAWFNNLILLADVMPDTGFYQLPAPSKKVVFEWYEADRKAWPGVYQAAGQSWFLKVWRRRFPLIRLRKYLRFAKCDDCVTLRGVVMNRRQHLSKRQAARRRLLVHYGRPTHHLPGFARACRISSTSINVSFVQMR